MKRGRGRARGLYDQSNILDKSSARNTAAKKNKLWPIAQLSRRVSRDTNSAHTRRILHPAPPPSVSTVRPSPLAHSLPTDHPRNSLATPPPPNTCKTNSRPFFCSMARIYIPRSYAAEARVPRREKGAGRQWSVRLLFCTPAERVGRVVARVREGGRRVAWVRWM